jgi:hypothetical protein
VLMYLPPTQPVEFSSLRESARMEFSETTGGRVAAFFSGNLGVHVDLHDVPWPSSMEDSVVRNTRQ